jgi:hypothetical protein
VTETRAVIQRGQKASKISGPRAGSKSASQTLPVWTGRGEWSFRVKIALFYDSFVRLAATLDSIFELAVFLGQLRHDLICPARGVPIEDRGLQKYTSSDPESVRDFVRRGRRLSWGSHTIAFRPTRAELGCSAQTRLKLRSCWDKVEQDHSGFHTERSLPIAVLTGFWRDPT